MSVKTTRAFSAYWNYQTWHLAAGEEVTGGLADYLLATGCPVEDLATAPAAEDPGDQVPDGTVAEVADWVGDDRTVDVHVRQLRKKLGDELPLATVWGVGYRLG